MKIRLSDDFVTSFAVMDYMGKDTTGCAFINCTDNWDFSCNSCELTKRKLNGVSVDLDLIRDLIIIEE